MLYKTMAKNAFPKKKRIAHFQMRTDNFTDGKSENELSGCLDYVSSIIENMDSSFNAMHSSYSKIRAKTKCVSNEEENSSSNKPTSSIHKDLVHNPKNVGKKILVSRKFPLMEKSQKILRQLKHNRNISKPRAHLATLPKSPARAGISKVSNIQKKKEKLKHINKVKNNPNLYSTTLSDISVHKSNDKNFKNSKVSKKVQNVIHKEEESTKSKDLSGYSVNVHLYNATSKSSTSANFGGSSLSDTKASENETTDSEYERFVKKNKKGLQKKVVKRQKKPAAKRIAPIKQSKGRALKKETLKRCDSEESDSDSDNNNNNDISLSNNSRKVSTFKKRKVARVRTDTDTEDDSKDTCLALYGDSPCDPDSGSDATLPDTLGIYKNTAYETSHITDDTVPKSYIPDGFSSHVSSSLEVAHETSHITEDTAPKSYIPNVFSFHDSSSLEAAHETSHITEDNAPKGYIPKDTAPKVYIPNVFSSHGSSSSEAAYETSCITENTVPKSLSHVSSLSEAGKIKSDCTTSNLVIDLCDSDSDSDSDSKIASCIEHSSISEQMEGANTMTDDLIGLFKNNSDCNNTISEKISLNAPKQEKILLMKEAQKTGDIFVCSLDSEESDIEVIDVVPTMSKDGKCKTNVAPKMLNSLKYIASDQAVGNDNLSNASNRNSQLVVKSKIDVGKSKVVSTEDNKYEAVYMTNICNDLDQDKLVNQSQRALISGEYKELVETSSKDILLDRTVLKKDVKTEDESDDDIVILDLVQSKVFPRDVSEFSASNRVKTETPDVMESLKCVKYSAHKNLKMGNFQNYCENPIIIDGRNTNIKNEQTNKNLSSLENRYTEYGSLSEIMSTFVKDELKLQENMCSSSRTLPINFSGVTCKGNQEYDNLKQIDEFRLIELYKKEFKTYQEIVQMEANFGASLKSLEIRQAERVEHIRSLVQKCIPTDQVFKENSVNKNCLEDLPPSSSISKTVLVSSELDNIKPNISGFDILQSVQLLQQPTVILKQEPRSSEDHLNSSKVESNKKQILKHLNEKCNACGKEAVAACQGCAKVFFCSHECGRKFWNDGHINECGKHY